MPTNPEKSMIPGVVPYEGREYLYVQAHDSDSFNALFPSLVEHGDADVPRSGGMIEEKAVVILPDGRRFYGISFRGDLDGWRKKIISACQSLGAEVAEIDEKELRLINGSSCPLDSCRIDLVE